MKFALVMLLSFAAGLSLGLFYFGGLWLTVRRLPTTSRPGFLIFGSFVGRTVLTVVGVVWVMGGRWERLIACLAGFVLMRTYLLARWKPEQFAAEPSNTERLNK